MDAQSFKETFLLCQGRLYRAALRLTGNKEEATSLRLNDKEGAECLSNQLPALTEKEGYKVDMAVQQKEKISFIFGKTEKLKNASKYRYRNNRIVYNQNGAETEFFWYVFLSVDKPEDTETKEQQ